MTLNNLPDIFALLCVIKKKKNKVRSAKAGVTLPKIGFKVVNAIPKHFQNIMLNTVFILVLTIEKIQCHSKLVNLILSHYQTLASFLVGTILL